MRYVPGGSYEKVITHEAGKTAEWLNEHGIAAMILNTGCRTAIPEFRWEDGEQAMRVIRAGTCTMGVDLTMWESSASGPGPFQPRRSSRNAEQGDTPRFRRSGLPVVLDASSSVRTWRTSSEHAARGGRIAQTSYHFLDRYGDALEVMSCCNGMARRGGPDNSIAFYRASQPPQGIEGNEM